MLDDLNIKTTIILAPFHEDYIKELNPEIKEFFEQKVALGNQFKNFKYIDSNKEASLHFVLEDFVNSTHLNDQGAKKFSEYVSTLIPEEDK